MAGGLGKDMTPQQIQALLTQSQPGLYQQNQGSMGLLAPFAQRSTAPTSTAQLYQNWTQSLLAPYMKQFSTPPNPMAQLQSQIAMLRQQFPDPNITPSGGGQ